MSRKREIQAQRARWNTGIELLLIERAGDKVSVGSQVVMTTLAEGEGIVEPTVLLTNDAAQFLIDELWRCGLRPTEGTGSAGSLEAVERHLRDMRAVAVGLLKKSGVEVQL